MAVKFSCDECDSESSDLTGWLMIDVTFLSHVGMPDPTSRGQLAPPTTLYFDKIECRDAWCAKVGMVGPS